MRQPPFLKPGDKIGLVAPARKVSQEEMQPAIAILKGWGYEPVEGRYLYGSHHQFSGTDEERAADFQAMIDNPEIKAIIGARGGYGSMRIIDKINFNALQKNPKWIAGFSDVTAFHSHLHAQCNIASLHSIMLFNMIAEKFDRYSVESLGKALSGVKLHYAYTCPEHLQPLQRNGKCKGKVIGGNLSLLYALSNSKSDVDTREKILFIEDLDEYLYHIDRMMLQLKRSGKLSNLAGLVVGGMSDMKDNAVPFGKTAEEIIAEAVSAYDYPLSFGFPAGHQKNNYALLFGAEATVTVGEINSLNYI